MTSGGGFETGADYVAAKVVVDVDGAGIQSLKEMSDGIDRLRTSTEATARSSASFISYIQQMASAAKAATEAHRDLSSQLERTAEMQMRGASGGSGSAQALTSSRLAPGGYVDPYAGMSAGTGGQRGPSPTDVQNHIDPTRQLDPRKYINAQAGRYNIGPGDMPSSGAGADWGSHANRVAQRDQATQQQQRATSPGQAAGGGASGPPGGGQDPLGTPSGTPLAERLGRYSGYGRLAANIANEMSPGGGSWGGVGRILHGHMQSMAQHADASAKGTGAEPAQEASEDGADAAETRRSGMGKYLKRGAGALGVGLGGLAAFEKGGAMYQGYKNMGMIRGGGAGEGFGDEASIRTMALNPFLTTEQSRQIVMAGLTEGYSGKQYDDATKFMADNLKNMNMSVSDSVQALRKNINEGGQSMTEFGKTMDKLKDMSKTGAMDLPDYQRDFMRTTGQMISGGVNGQAAANATTSALGMYNDDQTLKGDMAGFLGGATSGSAMGGAMLEAYGGGPKVPGLNPMMYASYEGSHGGDLAKMTETAVANMIKQMYRSPQSRQIDSQPFLNMVPIVQQRLRLIDPDNPASNDLSVTRKLIIKTLGGNPDDSSGQTDGELPLTSMSEGVMGNVINQQTPAPALVQGGQAAPANGSAQQAQALSNGSATWRPAGSQGPGYSMAQTPAPGTPGGAPSQTHVQFAPATIQVSVKSDGSASVSPNPLSLTPNVLAAQSGYGTATINNPGPGDGYPNPVQQ